VKTTKRTIEMEILPNGLVLIAEPMAEVRSVSAGIWLRRGSRREPAALNGISHFIEHMVFKGTATRSAEDIARAVDALGGMLDAFTSREMVCFNTRVLDEHAAIAFDVVSDMVLHPKFAEEDLEREKSVILEEIKMTQDNPEDLVHEQFSQNFWNNHPIGRPILGTEETVSSFDAPLVHDTFRSWYAPNNMVITAAGHITLQELKELAAPRFAALAPVADSSLDTTPATSPRVNLRSKSELEQVHICLGVRAFPMADERRFGISLLNNLLGGGMSSRLFQNIREKQGLAYAVFSDLNPYSDTGVLSVYAGTALATARKVVDSVLMEFRNMRENLVSEEELRRAKDHLKGAMLLSLESSGARMSNLARHHIYFNRFYSMDDLIAGLEAVTREDLRSIARELFRSGEIAASVVGNLNGFTLTQEDLAC
jgi:predicted Zn-dependent peptidase